MFKKIIIFDQTNLKIITMEFNFLAVLVSALSTLIVGSIWYSDKLFGNVWMQEAGLNKDEMQKGNMLKIFGLTFVYSLLISFFMQLIVIHQNGAISAAMDIKDIDPSVLQNYLNAYGQTYRTFKHGALHGFLASLFFASPLIAINSLFERKSWKYIAVHAGYWTITLMVMGAIICGWV